MGQYWCTVSFLRGGSRKCDTPLEAFCELAIGETEELLQDTLTYASEEMGAVRMTYVLTVFISLVLGGKHKKQNSAAQTLQSKLLPNNCVSQRSGGD